MSGLSRLILNCINLKFTNLQLNTFSSSSHDTIFKTKGLVFMMSMTQLMFAMMGILNVFIGERAVFMREALDGCYGNIVA